MRKPAPIGKRFNRLTVLCEVHRDDPNYQRYAKCKCDCGKITIVNLALLKLGHTKSCGCLHSESATKQAKLLHVQNTRHGMAKKGKVHPLYRVYRNMIDRCYRKKHKQYENYGGRGIKVCKHWLNCFENFRNWALPRWKEGLVLDRIDNDGDYLPSNCRFTTYVVSNNNSRNNIYYKFKGEYLTLTEIARKYDVDYILLFSRVNKGWSIHDAITTPNMHR